jgi:hypothetical protein
MGLFFIDYDLRKTRNYQALYDELARFKAVRVLESSWCFKRINTNCAGLRDHFKQFIDADDGLCITEASDWATYKALDTPKSLK